MIDVGTIWGTTAYNKVKRYMFCTFTFIKQVLMKKILIIITFLIFYTNSIKAQDFFKTELKKSNPAPIDCLFSKSERLRLHKAYLNKSKITKNVKHQLFGYLYLYSDYKNNSDYINLSEVMIQAENIAEKSRNLTWLGEVALYRGAIYDLNNKQSEALKMYEQSLKYCTASKDSICIAESLEQISAIYGDQRDFEKATSYFNKSLSIFKKYKLARSVAIAYNNYSNTLSYFKKYALAAKYIDSSLAITIDLKDVYSQISRMHNKGLLYIDMGEYDKALVIFNNNQTIIKKNNWKDRLMNNEFGLFRSYKMKGNYQLALEHLIEYDFLLDSLNGADVKTKITDLETKYKYQKKELNYKNNRLSLTIARQKIERHIWIISFLSVFIVFGLWLWRRQILVTKSELFQKHLDLTNLTNLLIQKNNMIQTLENKSKNQKNLISEDFELQNQRILTDSDWANFKNYYEKAYPGFINSIRNRYPTITQGEERLFLCLKINLKSDEIATMLGISTDSVKKSRNRLRKRLNLNEKEDLKAFVLNFNKT